MGYLEKIVRNAIHSLTADEIRSLLSQEQLDAINPLVPMSECESVKDNVRRLIDWAMDNGHRDVVASTIINHGLLESAVGERIDGMDLNEYMDWQGTTFEDVLTDNEDEVFDWVTCNYSLKDLLESKGYSDDLADYVREECIPEDFWNGHLILERYLPDVTLKDAIRVVKDWSDINAAAK